MRREFILHLLHPSTTQAIAQAVATAEVSFVVQSTTPSCPIDDIIGWGTAQSPVARASAQVGRQTAAGRAPCMKLMVRHSHTMEPAYLISRAACAPTLVRSSNAHASGRVPRSAGLCAHCGQRVRRERRDASG